jgi:hypothetical protein
MTYPTAVELQMGGSNCFSYVDAIEVHELCMHVKIAWNTFFSPIWLLKPISCEIVALREKFVDRPESYDSFSAKSSIFLAHEK